jgi:uncharacterized membrane protein
MVFGESTAQAPATNREKNKTVTIDSNPFFITLTSFLMLSLMGRLTKISNSENILF